MAQLGRISGPLLLDNLVRDGVDLSFRNSATSSDLLKLKVNNNRIGINTDTPSFDLDVIGSTSIAGNFTATGTTATLENVVFNSNGTITTITGPLIIAPAGGANAVVFHEKVRSAQLEINDNTISNTILNQGIEIRTSGVGDVNVDASTNIYGNLYSTANIRLDGTIRIDGSVTTIGNNPLDTIAFVPDFKQDINPGITSTFKLGDTGLRWKDTHINTASGFVNTSTTTAIISTQLRIASNIISTDQSNDDVVLASNNNNVRIERFNINTSTNTISVPLNTILNFTGEGRGYIRIQGTNAFRIPYGSSDERQPSEAGATRWNTDEGWLESFDGVAWQVSTGGGRTINIPEMEEIVNKFNLILG